MAGWRNDELHQALGVVCDVANEDEVATIVDRTLTSFGRLDMAFKNAGIHLSEALRNQPIGRPGTADEIAAAVLRLCSPGASFVVGVALPVDGGYTAA